jgi:hypothetical protein
MVRTLKLEILVHVETDSGTDEEAQEIFKGMACRFSYKEIGIGGREGLKEKVKDYSVISMKVLPA